MAKGVDLSREVQDQPDQAQLGAASEHPRPQHDPGLGATRPSRLGGAPEPSKREFSRPFARNASLEENFAHPKASSDHTMSRPLDRITTAAIKIFREQGVENARMEDIAQSANISRPNLYRYVNNKDDVVKLVVMHRARFILHELKAKDGPWQEALIDLFVKQVTLALKDQIFRLVVEQAGSAVAKLFVDEEAVQTSLNQVISPLLAKGRAAGEIRDGISDDEILYWLHYQTWSLTRDPNLHNAMEIRSLARKFVVGGLLKQPMVAPSQPALVSKAPSKSVSKRKTP